MPLCLSKQLIYKIAKTLTVYARKKFKISPGVLDNWDLPKRRDWRAIMAGGNIGLFCGKGGGGGVQENENAIFGGDVMH